jgi:hypothetical protein
MSVTSMIGPKGSCVDVSPGFMDTLQQDASSLRGELSFVDQTHGPAQSPLVEEAQK